MGDQSVFLNSKNDYANLTSFKNTTLETSNYLSFYPERKYVNEIEKGKEKKEESTFYGKYNAVNLSGEGVFNLEEEMGYGKMMIIILLIKEMSFIMKNMLKKFYLKKNFLIQLIQ